MNFKLLCWMVVGILFGDVMNASDETTQKQSQRKLHIERASDLWHAHDKGLRTYQTVQQEIKIALQRGDCCDYRDFLMHSNSLNEEAINIENHMQEFLINSCQAQSAITIRNHDRWCYHLPRYLCCIPLTCFYCCKGVDTGRYRRAQFNVIKAIALVEQNMNL